MQPVAMFLLAGVAWSLLVGWLVSHSLQTWLTMLAVLAVVGAVRLLRRGQVAVNLFLGALLLLSGPCSWGVKNLRSGLSQFYSEGQASKIGWKELDSGSNLPRGPLLLEGPTVCLYTLAKPRPGTDGQPEAYDYPLLAQTSPVYSAYRRGLRPAESDLKVYMRCWPSRPGQGDEVKSRISCTALPSSAGGVLLEEYVVPDWSQEFEKNYLVFYALVLLLEGLGGALFVGAWLR